MREEAQGGSPGSTFLLSLRTHSRPSSLPGEGLGALRGLATLPASAGHTAEREAEVPAATQKQEPAALSEAVSQLRGFSLSCSAAGCARWLAHPWCLPRRPARGLPSGAVRVGWRPWGWDELCK